ncbi:MAG: hypothetical protein M4D80_30635 [Myxococcota bacterium]|nr:hypothetical protein [Myxococcota bacterium]
MQLPQARIVKQGGQHFAPPPPPARARRPNDVKEQFREAAELAVGMWPLIAVMLLMVGLLISATYWSAP